MTPASAPKPAAVCFALAPNVSEWTTGYFATVGENIAPWVGVWATVAAAFSALNNIQPQMSSMSRALRFTALYRSESKSEQGCGVLLGIRRAAVTGS